MLIDLAGGDVVIPSQSDVEIAFIIAQIQIGLSSVIQYKDFACKKYSVLVRVSNCACRLTMFSRRHSAYNRLH